MHCKAVVANQHSYAPRSLGGQSAKTNLVRSNYSAAAAGPTPEPTEGRPILEKESNFFISVTHLGNGIRPTFLGYGENGRAARLLRPRLAEHYSHSSSN